MTVMLLLLKETYFYRSSLRAWDFDYEKFGNDLLEQEEYYELDDGRCIYYMM